jgi:tetratricopeptide (TPR) repeat protein
MKNYILFSILFAVFSILLLTGFQCASQEMTTAKLAMQQSDWKGAEKWLSTEVQKNPANAEAWVLLSKCRLQFEDYKGALEALNNVPTGSTEYAKEVPFTKQVIWQNAIKQGVACYNKSITGAKDNSLTKDSTNAYMNKAIEYYKIALQANKDSLHGYQNLAAAYLQQGNLDDGIAALKDGLKVRPNIQMYTMIINAYITKAQSANAKGDKAAAADNYNNAITMMQEARKLEPDNDELLTRMIDVYIGAGRPNEAKPYIEEALKKDPTNKLYEYNLGVIMSQNDDGLPEAITHFENALKIDPKYDAGLQNVGIAYLRLGAKLKEKEDKGFLDKFKKAVGYFESLRDLKPEDANVYEMLASAYINANMVKEGKAAYEKAQSLKNKK